MRMSCNGCRVLRKGCSESCILRPCLDWIRTAQSQANATAFLAKFYGRTGLINLISTGPPHSRPALFRSLLYEACGRILNPIYGSVGLLWSGNWALCQAGVESILQGMYPLSLPNNSNPPNTSDDDPNYDDEKQHNIGHGAVLMERIASELHKVKDAGKFKSVNPRRKPRCKQPQLLNDVQISRGEGEGRGVDIKKTVQNNGIFSDGENKCFSEYIEGMYVQNREVEVEVEVELTLGAQGTSFPHCK